VAVVHVLADVRMLSKHSVARGCTSLALGVEPGVYVSEHTATVCTHESTLKHGDTPHFAQKMCVWLKITVGTPE
jgi:hypothetical protein